MPGPLDGIRVLELGTFITGPYAGMLLADLGADVIKVERPDGGDPFRAYEGGLYSPQFQAYNRSKRSLAIDLSNEEGRGLARRLAERADVLIENFRPGVAEKLGLGAETLMAANPRLVYCSITGFGADGPYAKRPSYDTVAFALSGLMGQIVDPENPKITGPAMADAISGFTAAYGILGALMERGRTGAGRKVDVTMLEAVMAFACEPFSNYFATGRSPGPRTRASISQSYVFACADKKVIGLHLSSPTKFWEGLLAAIQRPDLARDARFATREARVRHFEALHALLAGIFATRPRAEWMRRLEANDVPFAPVYSLDEIEEDPHVRHLGSLTALDHPREGRVRMIAPPVRLDGRRLPVSVPPPVLGEHTDEVLRDFGLDMEEIARLRGGGVIGGNG